jgi:hypothetical protein
VKKGSPSRNASHTTPLTILAELGVIGLVLYGWLLAATAWALVLVARRDRAFGVGLGRVFLVLCVHSLLYAGSSRTRSRGASSASPARRSPALPPRAR